jgi:hypothetical protein
VVQIVGNADAANGNAAKLSSVGLCLNACRLESMLSLIIYAN